MTIQHAPYELELRASGTYRFTRLSQELPEVLGLAPDALAVNAEPVFQAVPRDELLKVHVGIERAVATQRLFHMVTRYAHPTLGQRKLEWCSSPHTQADGRVLFDGFVRDITEPTLPCLGAALCHTELSPEAADALNHLLDVTGLPMREALAVIVEDWARRLPKEPRPLARV